MADCEGKEIEASKNDFLRNIQSIAKGKLSYIYRVMFDRQTVVAKKCKPPRKVFNKYSLHSKQGAAYTYGVIFDKHNVNTKKCKPP